MSIIRMNINPNVIKHYIDYSEFNVDSLKQTKELKNVEEWMNGTIQPTFNQLKKLSTKLRVPLGYLVLDDIINDEPNLLEYRTIDSKGTTKTSRELIDTIKFAQAQQEFVSQYRRDNGFEKLRFINKFSLDSPIDEIINYARRLLDIKINWQNSLNGEEPLKFFRNRLNQLGIIVLLNGIVGQNTHRRLNIEEFRAFVLIDDYAPTIFLNTNDTRNAQLFSLLHEFAHILLGHSEVYNVGITENHLPHPLEQKCNKIAAEILLDNEMFMQHWVIEDSDILPKSIDLARKFKVSLTVIARKALDNSLISKETYNSIARYNFERYKIENNRIKEKDNGGHYWNNLTYKIDPTVFETVSSSFYEGNIQFTDAIRLLNISPRAFDQLEDKMKLY